MVYTFKIGPYARAIYIYGNQRFIARDGYTGIPEEYHQPVKEYAAKNFTQSQLDYALYKAWISQQDYADTVVALAE
ncbi:hypothetical protein WD019_16040 [Fictibacillus sp. Mic-4]|uniref:hypothetical protein n=1 Tax=Fictibacillus sp. Mic-4 TaxID=3132826 RepID=UPI003CF35985